MPVLKVFQSVADFSSFEFKAAMVFQAIAFVITNWLIMPLDARGFGPIPDLRFGYTPEDLRQLYDTWGEDGRKEYARVAIADIFLYMPAYTITVGGILFRGLQRAGFNETFALTALSIVTFDLVETTLQLYNCLAFPQFDSTLGFVSGMAGRCKWTMTVLELSLLLLVFLQPKKAEKVISKQS